MERGEPRSVTVTRVVFSVLMYSWKWNEGIGSRNTVRFRIWGLGSRTGLIGLRAPDSRS